MDYKTTLINKLISDINELSIPKLERIANEIERCKSTQTIILNLKVFDGNFLISVKSDQQFGFNIKLSKFTLTQDRVGVECSVDSDTAKLLFEKIFILIEEQGFVEFDTCFNVNDEKFDITKSFIKRN